jgi:SH3-like domain-containing protein
MKLKIALALLSLLGVGCFIGFNLGNINLFSSRTPVKPQTTTNNSPTPKPENTFYISEAKANVYKKSSTTSEVVTQALYGEPVVIIQENNQWLEIALKDQFNYQGWIEKKAVKNTALEINSSRKMIIAIPESKLKTKPEKEAETLTILPMGSVIISDGTSDRNNFLSVRLVDGRQGYIASTEVLHHKVRLECCELL